MCAHPYPSYPHKYTQTSTRTHATRPQVPRLSAHSVQALKAELLGLDYAKLLAEDAMGLEVGARLGLWLHFLTGDRE